MKPATRPPAQHWSRRSSRVAQEAPPDFVMALEFFIYPSRSVATGATAPERVSLNLRFVDGAVDTQAWKTRARTGKHGPNVSFCRGPLCIARRGAISCGGVALLSTDARQPRPSPMTSTRARWYQRVRTERSSLRVMERFSFARRRAKSPSFSFRTAFPVTTVPAFSGETSRSKLQLTISPASLLKDIWPPLSTCIYSTGSTEVRAAEAFGTKARSTKVQRDRTTSKPGSFPSTGGPCWSGRSRLPRPTHPGQRRHARSIFASPKIWATREGHFRWPRPRDLCMPTLPGPFRKAGRRAACLALKNVDAPLLLRSSQNAPGGALPRQWRRQRKFRGFRLRARPLGCPNQRHAPHRFV